MSRRLPAAVTALTLATMAPLAAGPSAHAARAALAARTAVVALPPDVSLTGFAPVLPAFADTVYNMQTVLLLYKPLVLVDGRDDIDFRRSLAASIAVSDDDTVYTVRLNPKWRWSDGAPVTAEDVAYTARLLMAACRPGSPLPYGGCGFGGLPTRWRDVRAVGRDTVVFTLTEPSNPMWFERNGLGQVVPLPEHVWRRSRSLARELAFLAEVVDRPTDPVYDVVDGPFRFAGAAPGQYWTFVPNTRYSGHKPSLSRLVYQFFASDTAEYAALLRGEVSVGYLTGSTVAGRARLKGYRLIRQYGFCFEYLSGNFSPDTPGIGATFRDLKVRQAIQMAIDQQADIRLLNGGYGLPAASPVPPEPRLDVYDASALPKPYPFDPAAGRRLLLADGWRPVGGVMTKGSVRLAFPFLYPAGSVAYQDVAALLQQDLRQEGIAITPRALPFDELASLANDTAQPANRSRWVMAWSGGWCYEPDFYPTGGGLFAPGGYANLGAFDDPVLTRLIRATYLPADPALARQRLTRYLVRAAEELPVWYLPDLPSLTVVAKGLHGVRTSWDPVEAAAFPNRWTFGP